MLVRPILAQVGDPTNFDNLVKQQQFNDQKEFIQQIPRQRGPDPSRPKHQNLGAPQLQTPWGRLRRGPYQCLHPN